MAIWKLQTEKLKGMSQEMLLVMLLVIVVVLQVAVLAIQQLLLLQIVQNNAHGNSATTTKLQTARNIKLQGAVSGNANFDGSGNIIINTTQSNIAILTGSTVVNASSSKTVTINYPSGYTESNCIPVAFALKSTAKG